MAMIMIYEFVVPEMIIQNQNEPPILTGRHLAVPVVNCPDSGRGDKTVLEVCETCEYKKSIVSHFVDCNYKPSPKEKDEIERRRKGVGVKQPISPIATKDPGQPKNVFIPKK
jgi:hypothetical protein